MPRSKARSSLALKLPRGDMQVTVNGVSREIVRSMSIQALLDELGLDTRRVAVELNQRIVKRDELDAVIVSDGDRLEVVHFVGGG